MKELLVLDEGDALSTLRTLRFKGWKTGVTTLRDIRSRASLPDVIVVETRGSTHQLSRVADALAKKQDTSRTASFVLFFTDLNWPDQEESEKDLLISKLKSFPNPDRVLLFPHHGRSAVKAAIEAIEPTVDLVLRKVPKELGDSEPQKPSMLDKMQKVLAATKDLRTQRGRLSAKLIADLYDLNQAELARWLGKQKQAVFKTPDAESLQNSLEYFERIARLRTELTDDDFRKWLRMPNEILDDRRPLELIAEGKWQLVADLVADMITGSPT